jgi:LacI family transcriptional regulator
MKTAQANGESRVLVSLVEKSLRKQIEKGILPAGSTIPAYRSLANTHNVSLATVQQAVKKLEEDGLVDVYQGRGAIVRGESMVWNPQTINNRVPGQGKQVGLFMRHLYSGYISQTMPEYVQGISDELNNWNLTLVLNMYPDEPSQIVDACMEKLHNNSASGFILWAELDTVVVKAVQKMKMPFLVLNVKDPERLEEDVRYVAADETGGVTEAINFLIRLGHRQIGFVGVKQSIKGRNSRRYQSYLDTLKKNGITPKEKWMYYLEGTENLPVNSERLFTGKDRPTAIFCDSDYKATAMLKIARDAGLSIPEDLSIIGFDDVPMAAQTQPPLTTVYKPRYEMGREAARMLACMLNGRDASVPSKKVLKTYLVHRDSCATPNTIKAV